MKMLTPSNIYISLQAIRFLAAAFVVFLHIHKSNVIGHFGVDLFFILSGYVIAMIINDGIEPRLFIKKRLIRIVPLYWLATLLIIIILILKPSIVPTIFFGYDYFIKSLLFIPFTQPNGVINPTLFIGWTLNYEMLFYFLAFLSLLLARKKSQIIPLLITFISLVILTSNLFIDTSNIAKFFSNTISFEFIMGIFAFHLTKKYKMKSFLITSWNLIIIIALFIFMIFIDRLLNISHNDLIYYRAIIFGIPSFLIIVAAVLYEETLKSLPQWVQYAIYELGEACYAIYLSHVFVLRIIDQFIQKYLIIIDLQKPIGAIIVLIIAVIAGIAVHNLIDKPMMKWIKALISNRS